MNYKKTLLLFSLALVLFFNLFYFFNFSLWWVLIPILFSTMKIILGSANIQSDFFTKVLCSGKTNNNEIAITFDDGPNFLFSGNILSTLEEFNAKATFFTIGNNIKGNENIIKAMDSNGHIIGNHTFSHSFFIDFKNTKSFKEEINQTSDAVFDITGRRMRLFRPPYGVTTPAIAKAAKSLDYDIIGWNIRSLDTTKDDEATIANRVIRQLKPGAIVLFHDSSSKTNIVLRKVLAYVRQNGIKIVPIDELLNIKAYN